MIFEKYFLHSMFFLHKIKFFQKLLLQKFVLTNFIAKIGNKK